MWTIGGPLSTGVYPRGCGEAPDAGDATAAADGLSPRVRGSRRLVVGLRHVDGSIPAGAGKPGRRQHITSIMATVYPRGCGEAPNASVSQRNSPDHGLSPRVRGSRAPSRPPSEPLPVYPRGCGEAPRQMNSSAVTRRSIPAGAGKPAQHRRPVPSGYGLSPRVRGSPVEGSRSALASPLGVYPRGCGEAVGVFGTGRAAEGLSPRVRGSRLGLGVVAPVVGSIPAGAGKPRSDHGVAVRRELDGLSPRVRGSP